MQHCPWPAAKFSGNTRGLLPANIAYPATRISTLNYCAVAIHDNLGPGIRSSALRPLINLREYRSWNTCIVGNNVGKNGGSIGRARLLAALVVLLSRPKSAVDRCQHALRHFFMPAAWLRHVVALHHPFSGQHCLEKQQPEKQQP